MLVCADDAYCIRRAVRFAEYQQNQLNRYEKKTGTGDSHITAKQDAEGKIVMHYVSPTPDPLRRITFFPPDESGWSLAFSWDEGANWTEVYRIRATPAKDCLDSSPGCTAHR